MSWLSIVSYFADSSRLAAIYAVITILILNDSFNNEELICMQNKDTPVIADINKLCHKRLLFNYSTKLGYYDENNDYNNIKELLRDYSNSIKNITININDFTSDRNYFTISYVYGAHLILILSTAGVSPHLLPISFYLIDKKTIYLFKERNLGTIFKSLSFVFSLIDLIHIFLCIILIN